MLNVLNEKFKTEKYRVVNEYSGRKKNQSSIWRIQIKNIQSMNQQNGWIIILRALTYFKIAKKWNNEKKIETNHREINFIGLFFSLFISTRIIQKW